MLYVQPNMFPIRLIIVHFIYWMCTAAPRRCTAVHGGVQQHHGGVQLYTTAYVCARACAYYGRNLPTTVALISPADVRYPGVCYLSTCHPRLFHSLLLSLAKIRDGYDNDTIHAFAYYSLSGSETTRAPM